MLNLPTSSLCALFESFIELNSLSNQNKDYIVSQAAKLQALLQKNPISELEIRSFLNNYKGILDYTPQGKTDYVKTEPFSNDFIFKKADFNEKLDRFGKVSDTPVFSQQNLLHQPELRKFKSSHSEKILTNSKIKTADAKPRTPKDEHEKPSFPIVSEFVSFTKPIPKSNTFLTLLDDYTLVNTPEAQLNICFLRKYEKIRSFLVIDNYNSFYRCVGYLYLENLIRTKDIKKLEYLKTVRFFWDTRRFLKEEVFPDVNHIFNDNCNYLLNYLRKAHSIEQALNYFDFLINNELRFLEGMVIFIKNVAAGIIESPDKCQLCQIFLSEYEREQILNEIYEYFPVQGYYVNRSIIEALSIGLEANLNIFQIFFNGMQNKLMMIKQKEEDGLKTCNFDLIFFDKPHNIYVIAKQKEEEPIYQKFQEKNNFESHFYASPHFNDPYPLVEETNERADKEAMNKIQEETQKALSLFEIQDNDFCKPVPDFGVKTIEINPIGVITPKSREINKNLPDFSNFSIPSEHKKPISFEMKNYDKLENVHFNKVNAFPKFFNFFVSSVVFL